MDGLPSDAVIFFNSLELVMNALFEWITSFLNIVKGSSVLSFALGVLVLGVMASAFNGIFNGGGDK